jgi:hemerythrin-like domain-containing protein
MKRSPLLQPLSREHHAALRLAKACERATLSGDEAQIRQACRRALDVYANQLQPHFQFEEQSLLPLLHGMEARPLAERTLTEHHQLRALLADLQQNDVRALGTFGICLSKHVRFEEQELFPLLESLLPQA